MTHCLGSLCEGECIKCLTEYFLALNLKWCGENESDKKGTKYEEAFNKGGTEEAAESGVSGSLSSNKGTQLLVLTLIGVMLN